MTLHAELTGEHAAENRAWYEQIATGWARWLRAGGQLGEWTDDLVADIRFASQTLFLNENDTLLNMSCGWGRHAIMLAHYGINVIGLETSADLLEVARETAENAEVDVEWICGDLTSLQLDKQVNAVVQFNDNLLSWAESPAEALHLLDQVHAVLKRHGRFLFGGPDWIDILPLQEQSLSETAESKEIYRHFFDPDSRTARYQTIVLGQDGRRNEYWRHTWHPTADQMVALLYQAGFQVEGQFNNFDYLPYDPNLPGLVWLVKKG
jgi:cyclopropane fatty-acyl-phospholipid synthase-like methyltransferase